jgi:hypothetical protein
MISFLKGAVIGFMLLGAVLSILRGVWWLFLAALAIGVIFELLQRALFSNK